MKKSSIKGAAATAIAAGLAIIPLQLVAQGQGKGGKKGPPGRTEIPRLSNGKPDFSGVWQHPYVPDMSKSSKDGSQKAEPLPFTAKGKAVFDEYDASQGDYTGACMPFGLVRSINSPHPLQIIQSPTDMALLFEQNTWFHVFPTDGRPLPKDPDPTWFGTTVGRWEGDKLITETIGFNGYTRLDTIGHPHSRDMKVIQTFEYANPNQINYTITIDDPKGYTKPFTNHRVFTYRPDWFLMEYSCEENNKDAVEGLIKPWLPSQNPPKL
jgi:hypothetical protein